jgi:uncharacterized protein (TIRG00374 family)
MAATAIPPADQAPALGSLSLRRVAVVGGASVLLVLGAVVLAPAIGDLPDVWQRLAHGDVWWLGFALVLEALSFVGHIVLFRAVSLDGSGRIGMRASTEITLAGHMATRVLATGGAGGVALTAWALRKSGMERRDVAARMTTFLVLLYIVYMGAMFFGGLGLYFGIIPGGGSFAITVVPAIFGFVVVATVWSFQFVKPGASRLRRWVSPLGDGVRAAQRLAASGNLGLLGAILWWGFDIAVLWACFSAFGESPAVGILIVAYFVGTLANLLPLPGGVGGVDGGMVGALVAFGTEPGLAIVAVLAYRFFAFWLPIGPGALAFASLRRTVAKWEREDAGELEPAVPARRRADAPRRAGSPCYCTK